MQMISLWLCLCLHCYPAQRGGEIDLCSLLNEASDR